MNTDDQTKGTDPMNTNTAEATSPLVADLLADVARTLAAANAEAQSTPYQLPKSVPLAKCRRCNGNGHGQFHGPHAEPTMCLDCLGRGMIPATYKAQLAIKLSQADHEVERLSHVDKGYANAVELAQAAHAFAQTVNPDDADTIEAVAIELDNEAKGITEALDNARANAEALFTAFTA